MAVNFMDLLPPEYQKVKIVSLNPNDAEDYPEDINQDLRWHLQHNLFAHMSSLRDGTGVSLGVRKFPLALVDNGITPLLHSIDPGGHIGLGPVMSALITVASYSLESYKPMQNLVVLRNKKAKRDLSLMESNIVNHIISYEPELGLTDKRGTPMNGIIPSDARKKLEWGSRILGLTLSTTFIWYAAIALIDQPEVHPELRKILRREASILSQALFLKADAATTVMERYNKIKNVVAN